jgi:hypothetical protein
MYTEEELLLRQFADRLALCCGPSAPPQRVLPGAWVGANNMIKIETPLVDLPSQCKGFIVVSRYKTNLMILLVKVQSTMANYFGCDRLPAPILA